MTKCPCGRSQPYKVCCGLIHNDIHKAMTTEDLMRARYTAFVMANGAYLMQSHHSTTRAIDEKQEIIAWAKSVQWIRLEILQTTQGAATDLEGTVHFKTYFFENRAVQIINEHPKFVRENGHWTYIGLASSLKC